MGDPTAMPEGVSVLIEKDLVLICEILLSYNVGSSSVQTRDTREHHRSSFRVDHN